MSKATDLIAKWPASKSGRKYSILGIIAVRASKDHIDNTKPHYFKTNRGWKCLSVGIGGIAIRQINIGCVRAASRQAILERELTCADDMSWIGLSLAQSIYPS